MKDGDYFRIHRATEAESSRQADVGSDVRRHRQHYDQAPRHEDGDRCQKKARAPIRRALHVMMAMVRGGRNFRATVWDGGGSLRWVGRPSRLVARAGCVRGAWTTPDVPET